MRLQAISVSSRFLLPRTSPAIVRGLFFTYALLMDESTNVGEIACELFGLAEHMIENGEDPEDVRAAFFAVGIRLKQLSEEADKEAHHMILRLLNGG